MDSIKDAFLGPFVALGIVSGDVTKASALGCMTYGLVLGSMFGVSQAKKNPNCNALGFGG